MVDLMAADLVELTVVRTGFSKAVYLGVKSWVDDLAVKMAALLVALMVCLLVGEKVVKWVYYLMVVQRAGLWVETTVCQMAAMKV